MAEQSLDSCSQIIIIFLKNLDVRGYSDTIKKEIR